MNQSKYATEKLPADYRHHFHAGNIGDVWKHVVMTTLLSDLVADPTPLAVLDCHAGSGGYHLLPTGEWSEGIGALLASELPIALPDLSRYLDIVRPRFLSERFYPGSPLLIQAILRHGDMVWCYEINSDVCGELRNCGFAKPVTISQEDGLKALLAHAEKFRDGSVGRLCALIDPPWNSKSDWRTIPEALLNAWRSSPQSVFALWYPIKSYTRVSAMIKGLRAAGIPAYLLELITTPLEVQRNRLNGSGMVLVGAAPRVVSAAAAAGTWIGRMCATRNGYWSCRVTDLGREY